MIDKIAETLSTSYFPTSQFDQHDFQNARFIEFRNLMEEIAVQINSILPKNKYAVEPHLGDGTIANVPWIGIHSNKSDFDSSSKYGLYLTVLWRVDGNGVYLSFQTGTDGLKGKKQKERTLTFVDILRTEYGTYGFEKNMDLKWQSLKSPRRPKNYENANIACRLYLKDDLSKIPKDIQIIEKLYNAVIDKNPSILVSEDGWSGEITEKSTTDQGNQDELSNIPNSKKDEQEIEELINPNKGGSSGQGSNLSGSERKAVESRAMEVTRQHLISLGYKMKDTSKNNSFDYLAFNQKEKIKVEVKGTTSSNVDSVRMTHNEIKLHQKEKGFTALAIVSSIQFLERGENPKCTGGVIEYLPGWDINEWKIKPISYQVYRAL